MAIKFDTNGYINVVAAISPSGAFRLIFPPFTFKVEDCALFRQSSNLNTNVSLIDNEDGTASISARLGTITLGSFIPTGLSDGDLVTGLEVGIEDVDGVDTGFLILGAQTVTADVSGRGPVLFQDIGKNYSGRFEAGQLVLRNASDTVVNSIDFSVEPPATDLANLVGSKTFNFTGFTTGGIVANAAGATTSTILISSANDLPATGDYDVLIANSAGDSCETIADVSFTDGAAQIDLAIADYPVGTSLQVGFKDDANELSMFRTLTTVTTP